MIWSLLTTSGLWMTITYGVTVIKHTVWKLDENWRIFWIDSSAVRGSVVAYENETHHQSPQQEAAGKTA